MVIPMLWRISEYVVCMMGVKNKNHHTHPYARRPAARARNARWPLRALEPAATPDGGNELTARPHVRIYVSYQ
jgi:hypothetical protein